MKERVEYIDIAKGISIFLVALYHSKVRWVYPEIIEPMGLFRMPLFFFLSGVFFTWALSPKGYFLKKFDALLKPYFVVTLSLFLVSVITGEDKLWKEFKGILYGNGKHLEWTPLWFLTHLFALYLFSYFLFRFLKFGNYPKHIQAGILISFLALGSMFVRAFWKLKFEFLGVNFKLPGLPYSVDVILLSSVFFISGALLKQKMLDFRFNLKLSLACLFLFLSIVVLTDARIDLNLRVYREPFFASIGAFCGIYLILGLAYVWSERGIFKQLPLAMGRASLFVLIFHLPIQVHVYRFLKPYIGSGNDSDDLRLLAAVVSLLLSVTVPIAIKWVVERNDFLALGFLPLQSNKTLQSYLNRVKANKA